MLHYVLLVLSAMIPAGLFLLAFSRLVAFHIGHSIIWGEMPPRYTCAQVKYQMEILGNIAIGCVVLNVISVVVSIVGWIISDGKAFNGDLIIWLAVCFVLLVTSMFVIMDAFDKASDANHRSDASHLVLLK